MGAGVIDGDGHRRRGGDVAGGVAGYCGQRVGAVGDRGGVPRHAVGRGGVLGAQVGAVHLELHPGHPDIVGGGGGQGHRARHGRAVGGRGEAHRRCDLSRLVGEAVGGIIAAALIVIKLVSVESTVGESTRPRSRLSCRLLVPPPEIPTTTATQSYPADYHPLSGPTSRTATTLKPAIVQAVSSPLSSLRVPAFADPGRRASTAPHQPASPSTT